MDRSRRRHREPVLGSRRNTHARGRHDASVPNPDAINIDATGARTAASGNCRCTTVFPACRLPRGRQRSGAARPLPLALNLAVGEGHRWEDRSLPFDDKCWCAWWVRNGGPWRLTFHQGGVSRMWAETYDCLDVHTGEVLAVDRTSTARRARLEEYPAYLRERWWTTDKGTLIGCWSTMREDGAGWLIERRVVETWIRGCSRGGHGDCRSAAHAGRDGVIACRARYRWRGRPRRPGGRTPLRRPVGPCRRARTGIALRRSAVRTFGVKGDRCTLMRVRSSPAARPP